MAPKKDSIRGGGLGRGAKQVPNEYLHATPEALKHRTRPAGPPSSFRQLPPAAGQDLKSTINQPGRGLVKRYNRSRPDG